MPVKQAFGSPGGKFRSAGTIVELMPPHKIYVEPFVGGGAVFYRKYPVGKEVLNDRDVEIIFANRFIRDMTPAQFEQLKEFNWKRDKARFAKVKGMTPKTDLERFYKFYYLKTGSFASGGKEINPIVVGKVKSLDGLWKCHERLARVKLHAGDYMSMIDKYDSPDTLFYLDPPYPGRAFVGGRAEEAFTEDDLRKLIERLGRTKGKFMLSLGPESTKLIPKHWHIKRLRVPQYLTGEDRWKAGMDSRTEILVSKTKLVKRKPPLAPIPLTPLGYPLRQPWGCTPPQWKRKGVKRYRGRPRISQVKGA